MERYKAVEEKAGEHKNDGSQQRRLKANSDEGWQTTTTASKYQKSIQTFLTQTPDTHSINRVILQSNVR
jgi:hypothetical protein